MIPKNPNPFYYARQPSQIEGEAKPVSFKNRRRRERVKALKKDPDSRFLTLPAYETSMQAIQSEYGTKGKSFADVNEMVRENQQLKKTVQFYADKVSLGNAEKAVGRKFAEQAAPNFNSMTAREKKLVLELLELDDWGQVAMQAGELAIQYGPQIYNWLKKWWNSRNKAPRRLQSASTTSYQSIAIPQTMKSHADKVCTGYFASVICPEEFQSARPSTFATESASFKQPQTYQVVTNAAGNYGGVFVIPGIAGSASNNTYNVASLNTVNFSPSTGVDASATQAGNTFVGPAYSAANTLINQLRVNSAAVQFIPSLSMNNNQGQVEMQLIQQQWALPNTAYNITQPAIPQALMPAYKFYDKKMLSERCRKVYVPCALDQAGELNIVNNIDWLNDIYPIGQFNQFVYVLVTGGPASTQVGTVTFTQIADYIPQSSLVGFVQVANACDAAATDAFVGAFFKRWPHASCMTYEQARMLGEIVSNHGECCDFTTLMKDVDAFMGSVPKPIPFNSVQPNGYSVFGQDAGVLSLPSGKSSVSFIE